MKVLLAVDGSPHTKKMLAYLVNHKDVFHPDNEFSLFNVQHALPPRARVALGKEVADSYHRDMAEKVLAPVTKFLLRHGINARSSWKTGNPGEHIAKLASAGKFDMVVMGSHGHGTLVNLVMGSVATQVIAHCTVPVLLVR